MSSCWLLCSFNRWSARSWTEELKLTSRQAVKQAGVCFSTSQVKSSWKECVFLSFSAQIVSLKSSIFDPEFPLKFKHLNWFQSSSLKWTFHHLAGSNPSISRPNAPIFHLLACLKLMRLRALLTKKSVSFMLFVLRKLQSICELLCHEQIDAWEN